MRKVLLKILFIFAFILLFSLRVFALGDILTVSSVVYDNSTSFLTINSFDNSNYSFDVPPKLHVIAAEKKAYFDIPKAILNCPKQDIIVKSKEINEIVVSQFSMEPETVRVVFYYNDGFNPYHIQLKKINSTLFLKFNTTTSNNYYFQGVYQEVKPVVFYESPELKIKMNKPHGDLFGQINSSFGNSQDDENDYVLSEKDTLLNTKYYIDELSVNKMIPQITGVGSYSVAKPFYLTNPLRVVYDINNTVLNPVLRNKEVSINTADTIKIGQFDHNTARVVITSNEPDKYIPVFYPDSQRLAFIDIRKNNPSVLYQQTTNLSSVKDERTDEFNYGFKLIFNNPVIFGLSRKSTLFELYMFNVNDYSENEIKHVLKSTPFSDVQVFERDGGGIKLVFNPGNIDNLNIQIGSDGKTLRVKQKLLKPYGRITKKIEEPKVVIPDIIPKKISGKKYVVIDPGHGGSDVGATRNNIYEKDITLDVAKRVENLLIKKGYIVQMTRNDDKTVSLQERVDFSENIEPDIFVSIHVNSSNSDSPSGIETHYYKDNSLLLAKCIHASMLNNISANDRGLFKSKFYVINHTTAPAILVEMGFISNPLERSQIVSESRKNATAKAIAEGIDEYFKE